MHGAPSPRNSTSFAPPTRTAPAVSAVSSRPRFLKHGEQTKILPPAATKLAIRSFSGENPDSWIVSAAPLIARRTPSVDRNTSASLSEAAAAPATTNATVARSGSSWAQVRLTQNFPGMGSAPSFGSAAQVVGRVIGGDERVPGQSAPGGHLLRGGRVAGDDAQHGAR